MKPPTRPLTTPLIALLCLPTWGCSGSDDAEPLPPRPVRAGYVLMEGAASERRLAGEAEGATDAKLSFRVNGQIKALSVQAGDEVEAGQVLAELDDKDLQSAYSQAKASFENAQIQRNTAKSTLERVRALYEANSTSLSDYESARNAYSAADSQFRSSRQGLDLQARQLGYARLKSTIDGVVARVSAEEGEVVGAGTPIVEVYSTDEIQIRVGIPEPLLPLVKKGMEVDVQFLSLADRMFDGVVQEVGLVESSGSGTYTVTVLLQGDVSMVRPGMPAEVHFQFAATGDPRLTVPLQSVAEDTRGRFTYVIRREDESTGVAERRVITVGALHGDRLEVISGVEEGELVATAGLRQLVDGMHVTLRDDLIQN